MSDAGQLLAQADGSRLTIGVTVPARGFAAAFAAAAAALCRDAIEPMAPDDLELHLADLRETPPRTPIKFHSRERIHDGLWLGLEEVADNEMLCFETRRMVRKLPLTSALSIRLTGETASGAQLQARRLRTSPLLKKVLGEPAALTYVTTTRADCLIVGTQTLLEEDLTSETFYAAADDACGGVLQDLARARDLPGARRYYRTVIVPSATGPATEIRALKPHVVVFDGARAYLRWRHLWAEARQLAIIDRSLTSAEEAASELSMAFIERASDSDALSSMNVPGGVEAICFERQA